MYQEVTIIEDHDPLLCLVFRPDEQMSLEISYMFSKCPLVLADGHKYNSTNAFGYIDKL